MRGARRASASPCTRRPAMRSQATAKPASPRPIFFHICTNCATRAPPMSERTFVAQRIDEAALANIAKKLAGAVGEGGVIHLVGPLGAGKTTFARALLTQLGVGSRVKSPTYSLIESYIAGPLGVQ